MQQEPSLVRLSEFETTGLDNQLSQGIDRSVGTKNILAGQDDKLYTMYYYLMLLKVDESSI